MADRYGGQLGHGAVRQMCLAHLLRDAKYAIDEGDEVFALGFRLLLLRAVAIGKRREALKDSTLAQYHADLERRLDQLLAGAVPTSRPRDVCSARCAAIATTCSASSRDATCPTPTTRVSAHCDLR